MNCNEINNSRLISNLRYFPACGLRKAILLLTIARFAFNTVISCAPSRARMFNSILNSMWCLWLWISKRHEAEMTSYNFSLFSFSLPSHVLRRNGTRHHMGILQMMALFNELAVRIPLYFNARQLFSPCWCFLLHRLLVLLNMSMFMKDNNWDRLDVTCSPFK